MLNFLKRLFKQGEQEAEKEIIKLENLESWLGNRFEHFHKNLGYNLKAYIERIDNEISKARENLDILRSAKLHNPNITVKEKQFMEGNRDAYTKRAEAFLKNLDFGEKDYNSVIALCSYFNKDLESFGKSTFKAYQVLKHFFANESKMVAINIKN